MSRRRSGNPFQFFISIALVLTLGVVLVLKFAMGVPVIGGYLVAINLVTFIAYFFDKTAAVRGYGRVPENVLHLVAAVGGTPAAFVSQAAFHHKTTKTSFRTTFWTIFIIQLFLVVAWLCYARPWA